MAPTSTPDKWAPPQVSWLYQSSRRLKHRRESYDDIVTIIVGEESKKSYHIYKGILTFYSGYFDKAFKGNFAEAASKEVRLADSKPEVYEAVQHWLYRHLLYPAKERNVKKMSFHALAEIWVFADAHDMPALQNASIDLMHPAVVSQWQVPVLTLRFIYESTVPTARVRACVIDIISKTGTAASRLATDKDTNVYPPEAVLDILRRVWQETNVKESQDQVWGWSLCSKYHVHADGVTCPAKDSRRVARECKRRKGLMR